MLEKRDIREFNMTRTQAIKMQEARLICMNNERNGLCDNYCENCDYCYEQGTLKEQIESLQILIDIVKENN